MSKRTIMCVRRDMKINAMFNDLMKNSDKYFDGFFNMIKRADEVRKTYVKVIHNEA